MTKKVLTILASVSSAFALMLSVANAKPENLSKTMAVGASHEAGSFRLALEDKACKFITYDDYGSKVTDGKLNSDGQCESSDLYGIRHSGPPLSNRYDDSSGEDTDTDDSSDEDTDTDEGGSK